MRIRDQYEWIVIGDHPGALLSASLASRNGFSVLALPLPWQASPQERTFWSLESGACLDQESNHVLGIGEGPEGPGLLLQCLERLGMTPQEKSQIQPEGGHLHVLTPRARVQLGPRLDRLDDELSRDLGPSVRASLGLALALEKTREGQQTHWREVFEQAERECGEAGSRRGGELPLTLSALASRISKQLAGSPRTARDWLSLDEKVAAWTEAHSLEVTLGVLEGMVAGATSSPVPPDLRMLEVLALMGLSRTGAAFRGGMPALRELLRRLARRNGVDLPSGVSCQRIFVQQGRFMGVLPSGHGTMVSASGCALGCPMERARPLIASSGRPRGRERWFAGSQAHSAAGWKFSVALMVNSEAIQPGMTRRMCWQEAGAPFLEIEATRRSEYGLTQGAESVLFLRTCMPMTRESLAPRFQRLMAARMLRKATEITPFLEFHILSIFPEFRPEICPELSMIYGFKSLEDIPGHLLLFRRPEGARQSWGSRSGIDRLFLASQEAYPELGSLGWTVASLEATCWLASEQRRSSRAEMPAPPRDRSQGPRPPARSPGG